MSRAVFLSSGFDDVTLSYYNVIMRNNPFGERAYHWKGGRKNNNGYVMIYSPDHPYRDQQGYVREHRLVVEKHLDRLLSSEEVVHHLNGVRNDNRYENLSILDKDDHDKIHLVAGKQSRFGKGSVPWNKGKVGVMPPPWNKGTKEVAHMKCATCRGGFVVPKHRESVAKYCSRNCVPAWNKGVLGLQPWHNLSGLRGGK